METDLNRAPEGGKPLLGCVDGGSARCFAWLLEIECADHGRVRQFALQRGHERRPIWALVSMQLRTSNRIHHASARREVTEKHFLCLPEVKGVATLCNEQSRSGLVHSLQADRTVLATLDAGGHSRSFLRMGVHF